MASRMSAAQTLTTCNGVLRRPVSKAPRRALPSIATTPRNCLAKPAMKRRNAASKACGSSSRNTRLNVSWLGMLCSNRRNWRSNASLARPKSAMSAQPSAPHRIAARAMTKTSSKSCRAFDARGSANPRKAFLNLSIRLPLRFGSRSQNPSCSLAQYSPQIQMRFPCPTRGEGTVRRAPSQLVQRACG